MSKIQVLDKITIDKIAAGEVIERPASIVKELVENAIDADAGAVTVEIRDGGISFIRITDNGCGIEREDVANAFLRHSTSKIRSAEDLSHIRSLGFRGEALSSIAAVSRVEMITKTKAAPCGISYRIEGGKEIALEETGAPEGTTFLVRQLFYNTPARRKFLRTPMTEASHVADLVTRLALSHPEISIQFINNGQTRIHTSGNGNLKDVIYHIYGREIAGHLLPVHAQESDLTLNGYLGEPIVSRGNRNFENYFINGRYIKSSVVSKAIEDGYKDFTMQHKYPFAVLHLTADGERLDVNVHPSKMEVRFGNQQEIYRFLCESVGRVLHGEELIPHVEVPEAPEIPEAPEKESVIQKNQSTLSGKRDLNYFMEKMRERVTARYQKAQLREETAPYREEKPLEKAAPYREEKPLAEAAPYREEKPSGKPVIFRSEEALTERAPDLRDSSGTAPVKQLDLFEERLLDQASRKEHKIIGQLFDTYWLVEFRDNLYIIDQHAAHERVLYEKTLRGMKSREYTSQNISPPIILELSMGEAQLLEAYMDRFTRIGFEIENFGPNSYAVCAVPDNLFGIAKKELLMEMLDGLSDEITTGLTPDSIDERIASMSCKAAVKGNMRMSVSEADALIGELLALENPYHCPHGRPTIIAMSKRELEKRFKRIV